MKRELVSIVAEKVAYHDPDLSWIGKYSSKPDKRHNTVKRYPNGSRSKEREFQYFISCNATTQQEAHKDHRRMNDYGNEWCMVGVRVVATFRTVRECGYSHEHRISSAGLWGIESDSNTSFFTQVANEEYSTLVSDLRAIGFSDAEIRAVEFDPEEMRNT